MCKTKDCMGIALAMFVRPYLSDQSSRLWSFWCTETSFVTTTASSCGIRSPTLKTS